MYQEPHLPRILIRACVAFLTGLSILVAGFLATGYQLHQAEREEMAFSARNAVARTDRLLDEAEHAALAARKYLQAPCTPEVRNELNRLTIQQPHLRVVSLLHDSKLVCSSFGSSSPRTVDLSHYSGGRLSLREGSVITPDDPLLILLTHFPEGTIATSIGATHIADVLSLLSTRSAMYFRVGSVYLSPQGGINGSASGQKERNVLSSFSVYPYSVEYTAPATLSFRQVMEQGQILIALFALLGLLGGALVWRQTFRLPTPYDYLAQAIKKREIVPWYQPVVCSRTGEIYGVEVLARWKHQSGMYIPPDVFIPQAEKSGLIIPLTRLLMAQAATDLAPVVKRMRQPFHIAFNVSAAHLRAGDLTVGDFRRFKDAFQDGSIQLIAEITEREPFEQSPDLDALLFNLRGYGVQIALDDFGTGYSNLGYLNTLPIDYIKIDRSFVSRLSNDPGSDKLVSCVISMARTLGLGIVAEGVETPYQANWLAEHQVAFLQGYHFSRPLNASAFIRMAVLQNKRFAGIKTF
ncbi:EAL domain-containing protein [Enterobacter kobei]|uniref:EAL domain-containing protein n=1 Tax=Enterobacter kobei TaxID=208224 RepID=UPI003CF2B110